MKERQIILSCDDVRAVLEGRKTQARRMVTPQPTMGEHGWTWPSSKCQSMVSIDEMGCLGPYGSRGDLLWVKETFAARTDVDHAAEPEKARRYLLYRATYEGGSIANEWHNYGQGWRSTILMPRWSSRLTLVVSDVRVQRLQDISDDDARAEGVVSDAMLEAAGVIGPGKPLPSRPDATARMEYAGLWDSINGKRRRREFLQLGDPGYMLGGRHWRTVADDTATWASNPFVWAITFSRVP